MAVKFRETRIMQNFYSLFSKWARKTQGFVYQDLKSVRQFRLRHVLKGWRKHNGKTEAQKNKEQAAHKFRSHHLLTRALVVLFAFKLKQARLNKILKKIVFTKFFKRRWVPVS
jgi:hypothetical protein